MWVFFIKDKEGSKPSSLFTLPFSIDEVLDLEMVMQTSLDHCVVMLLLYCVNYLISREFDMYKY